MFSKMQSYFLLMFPDCNPSNFIILVYGFPSGQVSTIRETVLQLNKFKVLHLTMVIYIIIGSQNIPVPQRPSSSQSDGPPRMSQSPMPGKKEVLLVIFGVSGDLMNMG